MTIVSKRFCYALFYTMHMNAFNTLGFIDHSRTTILIFEALEQIMSFLSDLARALKTMIRRELEKSNAQETEDRDTHALSQRERKLVQNLPDLLADLPVNYPFNANMTLCNTGPDILPETCPRDFRMARQNTTKMTRSTRDGRSGIIATTEIISPSARESRNGCSNSPRSRRANRVQIDIKSNTLGNGSQNMNYESHLNMADYRPNGCVSYFDNGYIDHRTPNKNSNHVLVRHMPYDLDQDECESYISSFQDINSNIISFRNMPPNNDRHSQPEFDCNNNNFENHQSGVKQRDSLDAVNDYENHIPLHSQGSGENPGNNDQPSPYEPASAGPDPHHEFTAELVRALRNIGDHLDTKLRVQDQLGPQAVLGTRKINIGKLLVETLRHHNIVGVAVGATLEMCLLYQRL